LKKEINLVETNSLEVLEEFEKIEDDNIDIYNQLKTDFFDKWEGVSRN